ncbi:28S ribosomal protein S9, putative [Pediculus humanus corporis]|uniref:28S ribosomal protein S9, putative n=1 Tax=Pediculus humanus subsp. corporis TaxID=121224 RepID=E0VWZ5_PEDHC|nr:28S ribosomal protein S9, putative [Pediculus humanus corporis]EEB17901.1 28S ribosomal protein S9, putative [Pediculus humanus corporis]
MAIKLSSKLAFTNLLKNEYQAKFISPIKCFCSHTDSRFSSAVKNYMKAVEENEKFMQEQREEFELGKKHLANMMGRDVESMDEREINRSIKYLFPSGLFHRLARPLMKPPEKVFKQDIQNAGLKVDEYGRPKNFLIYTTKPNFSTALHRQSFKLGLENTPKAMSFIESEWMTKKDLEAKFAEKLYDVEYEKFLEVYNFLLNHPYNETAAELIREYRNPIRAFNFEKKNINIVEKDGVKIVDSNLCKRDTSIGRAVLTYPGTGKLSINGEGIDYFGHSDMLCREQSPKVHPAMINNDKSIITNTFYLKV